MATQAITLNVDVNDLPNIVTELCNWAGLAPSNANAKQALINFVKQVHVAAALTASQLSVQSTINTATSTAGAIIIT